MLYYVLYYAVQLLFTCNNTCYFKGLEIEWKSINVLRSVQQTHLMMNPEITDIYTTKTCKSPRVVANVAVCLRLARTKFPPVFTLCRDPSGISLTARLSQRLHLPPGPLCTDDCVEIRTARLRQAKAAFLRWTEWNRSRRQIVLQRGPAKASALVSVSKPWQHLCV